LKWIRKAAENGHAEAQCRLGNIYQNETFFAIKRDYKQAVYWYRKSAEQGHQMAKYLLDSLCLSGYGIDKDYEQANHCFKKSEVLSDGGVSNEDE